MSFYDYRRDTPSTVEEWRRQGGSISRRSAQSGTDQLASIIRPFMQLWASTAGRNMPGAAVAGASPRPKPPPIQNFPSGPGAEDFYGGLAQQLNPMQGFMQVAQQMMQGQQDQGPDVWQELLQLQDPSRYLPDQGSLQQQAEAAASAQYDPLIKALQSQISGTRERGREGDVALKSMYDDLSRTFGNDMAGTEKRYEQANRAVGNEFGELENQIKQQYQSSQKEQEDTLKRLNIEAAMADTVPEQISDRDYFVNRTKQDASTARQALRVEGDAERDYASKSQEVARYAGVNKRSDLRSQLEEIISGLQSQVGAHEAAKSQAITSGMGQLQQQAMQSAQQQAQQEFQNRMAMLQYERQLRNDEFDQLEQGPGEDEPLKTLQGIPQAVLNFPNMGHNQAQRITQVMRNVLDNPEIGWDATNSVALNKYQLAQQALEEGRRMNLGPQQLAVLQSIALEYFGAR